MVFLIQSTQNRDGAAIQAKLDEIIRASAAHNSYIGIDYLTEEEVEELRSRCETRAKAKQMSKAKDAGSRATEAARKKAARAADAAT